MLKTNPTKNSGWSYWQCVECLAAVYRPERAAKPEVGEDIGGYVCSGCRALQQVSARTEKTEIDRTLRKKLEEREKRLEEREKELLERERLLEIREGALALKEKRSNEAALYATMVSAQRSLSLRGDPVVGSASFVEHTELTKRQKRAATPRTSSQISPGEIVVEKFWGHLRKKGVGVVDSCRLKIRPTNKEIRGQKITFVGDSQSREMAEYAAFRGCAASEVVLSGYPTVKIAETISERPDMTEGANMVCVMAGSNDDIALPERVVNDVATLAEDLRAEGREVLVTPLPLQRKWRDDPVKKEAWTTINRELMRRCTGTNGMRFLNIPDLLAGRDEVIKPDGVHLNPFGRKRIVDACLNRFLA